jgi:hypothetical protein
LDDVVGQQLPGHTVLRCHADTGQTTNNFGELCAKFGSRHPKFQQPAQHARRETKECPQGEGGQCPQEGEEEQRQAAGEETRCACAALCCGVWCAVQHCVRCGLVARAVAAGPLRARAVCCVRRCVHGGVRREVRGAVGGCVCVCVCVCCVCVCV